jgi:hypothetical protein
MVFNATFNNISVVSCSVLLVEELTNFITYCCIKYTLPWTGFDLSTLVMIGIDCTCSCKSSYLAITTTMPLPVNGIPNPLLILNGSSMWCTCTVTVDTCTCINNTKTQPAQIHFHPDFHLLWIIMLSCRSDYFSWFLFWKQWKENFILTSYSWKKVTIFMKKNMKFIWCG